MSDYSASIWNKSIFQMIIHVVMKKPSVNQLGSKT